MHRRKLSKVEQTETPPQVKESVKDGSWEAEGSKEEGGGKKGKEKRKGNGAVSGNASGNNWEVGAVNGGDVDVSLGCLRRIVFESLYADLYSFRQTAATELVCTYLSTLVPEIDC